MFRDGRKRLLKTRVIAANSAEVMREWLSWRPWIPRWWFGEISEIARTAGLRPRDALLLGGLNYTPRDGPDFDLAARAYATNLRIARVRKALHRLEERGYVESGWTVGGGRVDCVVTDSGTLTARAIRRTIGQENYPGEPRRRPFT